ncbi:MAG: oligosaccharide flippase family protein [Actinomycetota bacterium]|nr:oligosaccharide flippase family protein [Actinomycetota bacterium]
MRRNLGTGYVFAAVQVMSTVGATPVLLHGLGARRYGVWVICNALVSYLELFEVGFGNTVTTQLAQLRGAGDWDRHRRAAASYFFVLLALGAVAMLIGGVMALLLPYLLHVKGALLLHARYTVLLLMAAMAVSIPGDMFGSTLIAHQRFDLLNGTLTATAIVQTVVWVAVVVDGGGLVYLGLATAVTSLLGQLSRFVLAKRAVPILQISPRLFDRQLVRDATKISRWFVLGQTSTVMVSRIDVFLTGIVVGVPAAGAYSVGKRLATGVERLAQPAAQLILPRAAQLSGAGDIEGLRRVTLRATRVMVGLTVPLSLLLIVLARPAVHAWVGTSAPGAAFVVMLLAGAMVVKAPLSAAHPSLIGSGKIRVPVAATVAEALLNLGLSVLLGTLYGLDGIAMAALLAAAVAYGTVFLPFVWKVLGRRVVVHAAASMLRTVPASVVAGFCGYAVSRTWPGLAGLAAAGTALGVVYLAVFAVTGFSRADRAAALDWLRHR